LWFFFETRRHREHGGGRRRGERRGERRGRRRGRRRGEEW
jgi:hypothetical protein